MAGDQSSRDPDPHEHDLRLWDRELGGYGDWQEGPPESQPQPGPPPSRRVKTAYFVMMGICVGLFVLAWAVVDRYSTIAAVVMCAVALAIPPLAAIIANSASATDRRRR